MTMSKRGLGPRSMLSAALFAFGGIVLPIALANAQTAEPLPVQPNIQKLQEQGHKFSLGEVCTRMTNSQPGVIKRDGCGRWYCGRTEWKDIVETRPNFAQEMGCEWHLVGLHCLCQRPPGQPGVVAPRR